MPIIPAATCCCPPSPGCAPGPRAVRARRRAAAHLPARARRPRAAGRGPAVPDPARLLIVPDHYLTRMLLSQGVPPADLGVPSVDGSPVETDGRTIWRRFAAHWHLFRGTPSRLWLEQTFRHVFGVDTPLSPATADTVYDALAARLAEPGFRPRALFERFGIEVLATTESPLDDLGRHAKLAADGWGGPGGRVVTTFRPTTWWTRSSATGPRTWTGSPRSPARTPARTPVTWPRCGTAGGVRRRRSHLVRPRAPDRPYPRSRTGAGRGAVRQGPARPGRHGRRRGVPGAHAARVCPDVARRRPGHAAAPGAVRNHNRWLHARHGRDVGGDVPQATEYVHALAPLLDAHGNDPRLTVVLYARRGHVHPGTRPLAGGYAALRLGAPWWFLDSRRCCAGSGGGHRDRRLLTPPGSSTTPARSVPSGTPRRARRVDAGFLARLVAEHRLGEDEAAETIVDLAYRLPKQVFKFGGGPA
ncbi:glucuronate isomerase [Micromonospora sp. BRA006-A]|nr:glucuronate isomerase [Micromonospora sp. BRA006-A]